MTQLIPPSVAVRDSYLSAVHEFTESVARSVVPEARELAYAQSRFTDGDIDWLSDGENFALFVDRLLADARPEAPRPEGWSPSTWLWLVEGSEFLGSLDIRHNMTDFLFTTGGTIGYDIRPSARGRGLGSEILRLALPYANQLGFDPVLITCDPLNVASAAVIMGNGGVFEDERNNRQRYWVPTTNSMSKSHTNG